MNLNIIPIIVLGACIGSFLNVLIYRIPRKESFVFNRSHCTSCNKNLSVFDLFPIFSSILLGGKCRYCGNSIPIRYTLIEFFTAILFSLSLFSKGLIYGPVPILFSLISGWILVSYLIVLFFIDYDFMILPDSLTYSGSLVGLFLIFYYEKFISKTSTVIFFDHLSAYIFALFGFLILNFIIQIIIGKPGLGNGDAKLFAMSGAWLGFSGLEVTIALSFLLSAIFVVFGFISKHITKGDYIAFGPFVCTSVLLVWFFGATFWFEKLGNIFWWKYI